MSYPILKSGSSFKTFEAKPKAKQPDKKAKPQKLIAGPRGEPGRDGSIGFSGRDGISIKGEKGDPGEAISIKGDPGRDGADGKDGISIKGDPGRHGLDAPVIDKIDLKKSEDEISLIFKLSDNSVIKPDNGIKIKEIRGKSAYEIAVDNGFRGSEKEWLKSLVSKVPGPQGYPGFSPPPMPAPAINIDEYIQKFMKDKGPFPGTGDGTGGPNKKLMKEKPYLTRGPVGPPGLSILNGARPPTLYDGTNDEFWIDTNAWMIYGPKANDEWPAGVSMTGGVNLDRSIEIDYVSSTVTYIGYSQLVTANPASAIWKIVKLTDTGTETVKTYADGVQTYVKIWNNRASYTYS